MTTTDTTTHAHSTEIVHIGHDELIVRDRYEVISILNDILIGVWFIIGSIFFLFGSLAEAGTWLFIIGSLEMLIRPVIRLARRIHLKRFHRDRRIPLESAGDF